MYDEGELLRLFITSLSRSLLPLNLSLAVTKGICQLVLYNPGRSISIINFLSPPQCSFAGSIPKELGQLSNLE